MDNDRLRTWTILALSFIRLILILLVIYLGLVYIRNVLFRPKFPCSAQPILVDAGEANEIAEIVLRALTGNTFGKNGYVYAFDNPKGETIHVWKYSDGMLRERDIDTLEASLTNQPGRELPPVYKFYIESLKQNKAIICIDHWSGGYGEHMGGSTVEWTLEGKSGQWSVTSTKYVWQWDGGQLP